MVIINKKDLKDTHYYLFLVVQLVIFMIEYITQQSLILLIFILEVFIGLFLI